MTDSEKDVLEQRIYDRCLIRVGQLEAEKYTLCARIDELCAENERLRAEVEGREDVIHCRDCDFACICEDGCLDCNGPLTSGWDYYNDEPLRTIVSPDGFCAWGCRRDT